MVEQQTEMSLDDVLSSIKQMVIDKDPPVLELTDMISSDGTIVKVKNGQDESGKPIGSETNLTDFLRLAQEKGKETEVASSENSAKQVAEQKSTNGQSSTIAIDEIIREVSGPIIKDWLDKNLLGIVKEVVAVEIRNMMSQK